MKKSAIYLILAALTMLLTACVREGLPGSPAGQDTENDGTVTLSFGVSVPDAQAVVTRAIGDIEDQSDKAAYLGGLNLYIFVFEDTGSPESNYLRELVYGPKISVKQGQTEPQTGDDGSAKPHPGAPQLKFTATFDGTAEKAILHIVATADPEFADQLLDVADRSELGMFTGINGLHSHGYEAYWRRVELERPISNDAVDAIKPQIEHVQLLRNFARVKIVNDLNVAVDGRFKITGYVVVNASNQGYVAAYNENVNYPANMKPEAGFVSAGFEHEVDASDKSDSYYGFLSRTMDYVPTRHPGSHRIFPDDRPGEWVNSLTDDDWNPAAPKYIFERPSLDEHRSFILLRGEYTSGGGPRYFKLDIGTVDKSHLDEETEDADGEFAPFGVFETFDVVRNTSYEMTILHVPDGIGHSLAENAVAAPPSNNIPTSMETKNLLRVSDGVNQMEVNATTVVIVDKEDENGEIVPSIDGVEMRWRYYTDYMNPSKKALNNDLVKWNFPGFRFEYDSDGAKKMYDGLWGDQTGVIASVSQLKDYADAAGGDSWKGFDITFNKPDNVVRQKTVRLYSPYGLTRDVTFILRNRWEFVNTVEGVDGSKYESNVEVYPGFYSYEPGGVMPFNSLAEMRQYISPGEVGSQRGAQLTVMFELPGDIPQALFPLQFKIGFDRQNVENAYVGNANVVYGDSMFEDQDDPSYSGTGNMLARRMQFVKTVDWTYYNGTGEPGNTGHKIVTARFMTTTDVLGSNETDSHEGDGPETSTTRVRVYNEYFTLGKDSFNRMTRKDDKDNADPDPNRTVWNWYFGDPGWIDYFSKNGHGEGTYNELWFKAHDELIRDGYALKMAIPNSAAITSATNPEFRIQFDSENNEILNAGGYTIKLTLNGASEWYRHSDYYYRRPYAAAVVKTASGGVEIRQFAQIEAFNAYKTNSGNNREGKPKIVSQEYRINPGEKLESIVLWSDRESTNGKASGDYCATLWYGIRCEITPN